jgi:carbon-monoxide dehydrogenase medium subunit
VTERQTHYVRHISADGIIHASHLRGVRSISPERVDPEGLGAMLVGQRSRHRIPRFELHRPASFEDAVSQFVGSSGSASYMSGGLDLINRMKSGEAIRNVVHLGGIPERSSIHVSGEDIFVGGGITHQAFAGDPLIRKHLGTLSQAWARLANVRIRSKGTIGGNLMAREVAYDFPIVALALGAICEFATARSGLKQVDAADLGKVDDSDLLMRVRIPKPATQSIVLELGWKPVVAFASSFLHDGNYIKRVRLSVGSGFARFHFSEIDLDTPLRLTDAQGRWDDIADRLVSGLPEPLQDWRASAKYRRRVLRVLLGRQLASLRPEMN